MAALLTIGEFSCPTYVSVKALRHYHDVGLLVPAGVDPATGYRFYVTAQAPTALCERGIGISAPIREHYLVSIPRRRRRSAACHRALPADQPLTAGLSPPV